MKFQNKRLVFGILVSLLLLNVLAWVAVYDLNKFNLLDVTFFNVEQGDAVFIETPQSHQIIIDGGPDSTILEKLGEKMPFWDGSIDLIILTHPENDHLVGLLGVLKRYKVENILWTGVTRDTAEFKEWEKLIEEEKNKEGAKIKIAQAGQKILWKSGFHNIDNSDDFMEILFPFEDLEGKSLKDSNNTSVIVKLVFGKNSFLFTGDAYKSVEGELLEKGADIDSDVLKVGHHGSKTSSAEEFIKAISPEIAVISAGKDNSYGHPHQETLDALEKYGITVLRTDVNGDIKFLCDSQSTKQK